MALVRWNPNREMTNWQREWNRMLGDFLGDTTDSVTGNWAPQVDIYEDENHVVVSAALPGMAQEDISVNIENNTLTISGERKFANEEKKDRFTRVEQFYGNFTRSFALPNTIDQEKIEATMDKGILSVTLPKREETKPRSIKVKVH